MAPHTRNSDKKQRRSRRKEVRFPKREFPVRKSATAIRPPANYENLILYYLTKLKRLFSTPEHPHPRSNENSADKLRREQLTEKRVSEDKSKTKIDPDKYTARRTAPKPRETIDSVEQDMKEKVYNVVNAAIQYGFANNVLEKKGDCFVFKNKRNSKIANRQLTPGPSTLKKTSGFQCNCNKCKHLNIGPGHCPHVSAFSEHRIQQRPISDRRPNTSVNPSRLHLAQSLSKAMNRVSLNERNRSSRSKSCVISHGSFKDRLRRVCSCRKCRLLEKKRKIQRK